MAVGVRSLSRFCQGHLIQSNHQSFMKQRKRIQSLCLILSLAKGYCTFKSYKMTWERMVLWRKLFLNKKWGIVTCVLISMILLKYGA